MEHILRYNKPANLFEEALPIGNGRMGAMVYSRCDTEKISLNEESLWTGSCRENPAPEGARDAFFRARELVLSGKIREAEELLGSNFNSKFSQKYLPLGNLFIDFGHHEAEDYLRTLDLSEGVCKSEYRCGGVKYSREAFASYPDDIIAIRLSADMGGALNFSYYTETELREISRANNGNISLLEATCPTNGNSAGDSGDGFVYEEGVCGVSFALAIKLETDGRHSEKNGKIFVEGASEAALYISIKTSFKSFAEIPDAEYKEAALSKLSGISLSEYEKIKAAHIADFSAIFGRTSLKLSESESEADTYERLKNFDGSDKGLYELLFGYGRYLLISSSRGGTLTANLQGIWNEHLHAPWDSTYVLNINTEMNYWHAMTANLADCFVPFVNLAKRIRCGGRSTAEKFYGARGFVCHNNTDLWGMTNPIGEGQGALGCSWSFWCMGSGWVCCQLFDAYEYTLDRGYLEEIYPIIREAAEFYLDILYLDGGEYILCPSTSPENQYIKDGEKVSLSKSTTMTESILRELLDRVIRASELLSIEDDELIKRIREVYPLLKKPRIAPDGRLAEWAYDEEENDRHHRHVSHLYSLYPGTHISLDTTPELAEACKKSLLFRGDDGTGWSLAWKINLWAALAEGDHALELLKMQLRLVTPRAGAPIYSGGGGIYPNMLDAHPPFQIDGNFGSCAAIANMLLQSRMGLIKLLPALPASWHKGEVSGLITKGNITVDMRWENAKIVKLTLQSPVKQSVKVAFDGEIREIELEENKPVTVI